uniref:PID domain-containing protein n=1 Tax=Macrostomum lignano TaxID=282301 RepID=A0A1I8FRC2_9PLAT
MPPSFLRQLPAVASPVRLLASVWSPTAGPNCGRILIEQLDGGADGSKAVRLLAEVLQALGAEFPAALLRQADCSAECASRPLRRHLDLYKALAPYDETVCCGGFGAVWLCNPGGPDGIPILCKPTPVPQPCFFFVIHPLPGVAAPGRLSNSYVASFKLTMPSPPSAELRPVHPAQVQLLGLLAYAAYSTLTATSKPMRLHNSTGAKAAHLRHVRDGPRGKIAHDVLTADNQTLHCITDLVNLTCSQPMFSRQPKLFVFQFCRGGDLGSFFIHYLCQYAEAQMEAHRPVMLNELMASVNRQLTQQNDDGIPLQPSSVKKKC